VQKAMTSHRSNIESDVNKQVVEDTINNLIAIINLSASGILNTDDLKKIAFSAKKSAEASIVILKTHL
jgi:hypothetical protein